MAVIDETRATQVWQDGGFQGTPDESFIIQVIKERFWIWFYDNPNLKVASLFFWSIRLRDLKSLFERIFGEMPPIVHNRW